MKTRIVGMTCILMLGWNGAAAPGDSPQPTQPIPEAVIEVPGVEDTSPALNLREKQFFYGSFGMRDPFRSLVGGDFEPEQQELIDLHTVQLVGMLWEDEEYIGIVQDAQGFGYALRSGDPVRNGVVVSITRRELVGRLNVFGMVDRVNLRLQRVRDEE